MVEGRTRSGENRPLLDKGLAGTDEPLAVDLALEGLARLVIVVDYGPDLDIADHLDLIDAMIQFFGVTHEEAPQTYDETSSIQRVHAGVPPTLLLHGTDDLCVADLRFFSDAHFLELVHDEHVEPLRRLPGAL